MLRRLTRRLQVETLARIASFDGDAAVAAPCLTSCNRSFASGEAASESLAKISPRYGPGGIGATEIPTPSDLDESGTDAAATVQGESSSSFIGEVTAADNTASRGLPCLQPTHLLEEAAATIAQEHLWEPAQYVMGAMMWLHDWSGLPWWVVLAMTGIGGRLLASPGFSIAHSYGEARAEALRDAFNELPAEKRASLSKEERRHMLSRVNAVLARQGHTIPRTAASVFVYCYFTVSPFSATQALTAAKLPSMTAESDAFLGDLTQVDATGVLPVMSLVSLLGVLELHIRHGGEKEGIGSSKKRLWRVGCILSYVLMRNLHTGILELLLFSLWAEGGLMYRRLGARRELGAAAEVAVAAERPKEVLVQTPPVSGRSLHRAGSSVKKRRF